LRHDRHARLDLDAGPRLLVDMAASSGLHAEDRDKCQKCKDASEQLPLPFGIDE